jgi:hypothetical protein
MTTQCTQCGSEYKRIGSHWSQSPSCDYPSFDNDEKELLNDMLIGDATVTEKYGTGRMTIEMVTKPFLEWVSNYLGVFATDVRLKHTAEEKVEKVRQDDYLSVVNENEWSATYVLKTRRHPYLTKLRQWYDSGKKKFPTDTELTSLSTKMWYCCDGTLHKTRSNTNKQSPRAKFVTINEDDRIDFIQSLFTSKGFDARKRENGVTLTVSSTKDLCDWMGSPPPSFEYKWV